MQVTRRERLLLALGAALFAGRYLTNHHRPHAHVKLSGWRAWHDQSLYLGAADGWARHLPADPASQSYEPGYPLLAAPFERLGVVDPFFLPNLACALLCCWCMGLMARDVLGDRPWTRAAGMAVFLATSLLDGRAALVWTTPWTTTPSVALALAAIAATLAFSRAPEAARTMPAVAGALAGAIALIRPGDVPLVAGPCGAALLWTASRMERAAAWRAIAGGAAGLAAALAVAVALHASVWGLHPSPYMTESAKIGFEPRLLAVRWVTVMVGPAPLTPGCGIAEAFPYLLAGLPMLLATAVAGSGARRLPHLVLGGYVLLTLAEFLSYRDLHPTGIWHFQNLHYFKALLPVGGLYAVRAALELARGAWRGTAGALALAVGMFCWCPTLRALPPARQDARIEAGHRVALPQGFPSVADAVLLPLAHPGLDVQGPVLLAAGGGRLWRDVASLRAYPSGGDALVVPLRPIAMPLVLSTGDGPALALDMSRPALRVRQVDVFRPPAWMWPAPASAAIER